MKTPLLIATLFFWFAYLCLAQSVLIPAYDAPVGERALAQCPKGKERQLTLICNPNSGPGASADPAFHRLINGCNAKGVRVLFYIDLVAYPGDGLYPPSAKEHVKTCNELLNERTAYSRFYGDTKWDGWFFDDTRNGMDVINCLASWPLDKVFNPGTSWTPPKDCKAIVSEQAGAWPRKLTAWESANLSSIGVMGLKISAGSLPAFNTSTRGMAYRYASPLDDKWQNGQSAYSTLTPYFLQLFP